MKKNNIKLIVDGHNALSSILDCIKNAKKNIHIRMYMWRDDNVGKKILYALEEKIQENPSIHIQIEKDRFGTKVYNLSKFLSFGKNAGDIFTSSFGKEFLAKYKKNIHFFLIGSGSFLFFKILKENDHSKIFVFDKYTENSIAILGGMNISNEYLTKPNPRNPDQGGWHDYMVYIKGDIANHILPLHPQKKEKWLRMEIIHGVEIVFNIKGRRKTRHSLLREIRKAKKSIMIEHGYLTDDMIIRELRKVSRAGIKVIIIMPDRSDGAYHANMHAVYKLLKPFLAVPLQPSLIEVYLYRGMIHAKVIVIDEQTTIIGSANLTFSSFELLNETTTIFRQKDEITKDILKQVKQDMNLCEHLTLKTIPYYSRIRAWVEKIFI